MLAERKLQKAMEQQGLIWRKEKLEIEIKMKKLWRESYMWKNGISKNQKW